MTKRTFEAAIDSTSKIRDVTPTKEKINEMFSFLARINRLAEICSWEGPSGIMLEVDSFPENTAYEKTFKECLYMWLEGSGIDEVSDHAAERYFSENPLGYDAAIFFAAVFSIGNILIGEHAYGFIDCALQFFLPNGWRWREEDDKEADAHKDDESWFPIMHSHRKEFLGDPDEEIQHRFDDIKVCDLLPEKDDIALKIGKLIADKLADYKDGALQLILVELTYKDLENILYVLPKETEDRIMSNLSPRCATEIKGHCILKKDSISLTEILLALKSFIKAINTYHGNPYLEAGYN